MRTILSAAAVFSLLAATASADPLIDSWLTDIGGQYARVYLTTNDLKNKTSYTTWSRGSVTQAVPAYAGVQQVLVSTNWVYIKTSGMGAHTMGPWYLNAAQTTLFPNLPGNTKVTYRFPRTPTGVTNHALTALGAIGYFVDGVAMFDSRDGYVWTGSAESGSGTGYWNRDAYVNEGVTFDPAFAHQEQSGTYHYHANPIALRYDLGDHVTFTASNGVYAESAAPVTNHSPILGWVRDGHPIYGPYGYANATNPASGVSLMRSGYQLRNGTNGTDNLTLTGRTYIPAWAVRMYGVASNQAGPTINTTYPLGRYMEDNAYLGDLGYTQGVHFDLDEYNGRWCVTPEFTNGVYAYFVSIASNGAPKFPYNIGRAYHAAATGSTVTAISEAVTTNFTGEVAAQPAAAAVAPAAQPDTITLVWDGQEGGGYVVESTTNLTTWQTYATNVAPSGSVVTVNAPASDNRMFRLVRTSLSNFDSVVTGAAGAGSGSGIVSISPTSGTRGTTVANALITIDANAPPTNAPVISCSIGAIAGTSVTRPTRYTVQATFTIPAGAATGPQTVSVVFPGPPATPTAYVTNALPNGFTIQ